MYVSETGTETLKKEESYSQLSPEFAFMGPNLWDKTCGHSDFNIDSLEYLDLDEFLAENGIPVNSNGSSEAQETDENLLSCVQGAVNPATSTTVRNEVTESSQSQSSSPQESDEDYNPDSSIYSDSSLSISSQSSSLESQRRVRSEAKSAKKSRSRTTRHRSSSPESDDSDAISPPPKQKVRNSRTEVSATQIPGKSGHFQHYPNKRKAISSEGQENFDPQKHKFSKDELKPQPIVKKSKKIFVADEQKDERYWSRRKKNNVAAKRSRDARRAKENQIVMRASFLEHENERLRTELAKVKEKNIKLMRKLSKYAGK